MRRKKQSETKAEIHDYRHDEKRTNNPSAGMMADYEPAAPAVPKKTYAYDPHLDPQLMFDPQGVRQSAEELIADILSTEDLAEAKAKAQQLRRMQEPWLQWAGKAEGTSFEVDNVPLYIHERISTQAILRAVQREEVQKSLFGDPEMSLSDAVDSYRHSMDWANRLVLGDSLVVMNSLLERELMAGKVQMIYLDPPYGIGYNSNFQPSVDQRNVRDGLDEDLTREPEQIKAYRDTWTLGIHSYMAYLKDRLVLARELLSDSGSIFVQIGDANLHLVRCLLDEVFGRENFVAVMTYQTTSGLQSNTVKKVFDFLLWYARDAGSMRYRQLYTNKGVGVDTYYNAMELPDGQVIRIGEGDAHPEGRFLTYQPLVSAQFRENTTYSFPLNGKTYHPGQDRHWKTTPEGLRRLAACSRLHASDNTLKFVRYHDDFPATEITNFWSDVMQLLRKSYAVQTSSPVIERCMLMTTDPGDLVLDPTCGSGTTAYVAEQWGRRWITCDTSRVAVFLARQRLLTSRFDYYRLADDAEGVDGGFVYGTVPHITLKSIASNPELDPEKVAARREALRLKHSKASDKEIERLLRAANEEVICKNAEQETLYDQPEVEANRVRVSGPFTVEAIPPPSLEAMDVAFESDEVIGGTEEDDGAHAQPFDTTDHIATLIEQLRQDGVLFPNNKQMQFAWVTGTSGGVIHAEAEPTNGDAQTMKRIGISFGPLYGSITSDQVAEGLREANIGGYQGIIFCGFAFDAEAQAVISADTHKRVRAFMAHVRPDMLMTDDEGNSLLKTTASSQLFTVFGEPELTLAQSGDEWTVELLGVDIYNPLDGTVTSDKASKVAAWFIDSDYDGRTFCVCQAFFPDKSAWDKLERALKGSIDPDKFDMLTGTVSFPFKRGKHGKAAIKVIDRRGNEVMVVRSL